MINSRKLSKLLLFAFSLIVSLILVSMNTSEEIDIKERQSGEFFLVSEVIDGDTIKLNSGQTVRYIGIDTPETVKPNTEVECFGKEASKRNRELVLNKLVSLESDVNNTDKYGRLLRYVYLEDGNMVNEILVSEGYANASSFPPDIKYQDLFRAGEEKARENMVGLWKECQ